MQAEPLANQTVAQASPGAPGDFVLTAHQMAELREAWLDHQVSPVGENQKRGVPYSALND